MKERKKTTGEREKLEPDVDAQVSSPSEPAASEDRAGSPGEGGAADSAPPVEGGEEPAGRTPVGGEEPDLGDPKVVEDLTRKALERDLLLEELARARADLDNYQKRMRRERPQWEAQAVRRLVRDLLHVVDNFERGLDSLSGSAESDAEGFRSGVEMIHQMFQKTLKDHGVEEVPAVGCRFDPEVHEAVDQVEVTDRETGEVVDVLQRGYVHHGVLVRPSRVRVAKRVEASPEST